MNQLIEIKELRIGNLLSYDNQIVHVTSLSLDIDDEYEDQIGFCKLGSVSNEIAAWNRSLVDKLAPIALTPEWLERCGYMKYVGNTGQEIYKCPVGSMALYKLAGSKDWIIGANDFSGGYLNLCTISYFHQLQNLYFALTGEELMIKQ